MPTRTAWQAALLRLPHATLTYAHPSYAPEALFVPGQRVLVPLGKKNTLAVAVLLGPASEKDAGAAGEGLKELLWPLEHGPLLTPDYLEMITALASRQMVTPGKVMGGFLPSGLRTASVSFTAYEGPSPTQIAARELADMPVAAKERLAGLWQERRMEPSVSKSRAAEREYVSVACDPPWTVRPAAHAQIAILDHLWDHGGATRRDLVQALGQKSAEPLRKLAKLGLVRIGPPPERFAEGGVAGPVCDPEVLNGCGPDVIFHPQQAEAVERLATMLPGQGGGGDAAQAADQADSRADGRCALLHGITGSGKTAVYLELARRTLAAGRSVMLLAPEVALAAHLRRAVQAGLPDVPVAFHHGYLAPSRKDETFSRLAAAARAEQPVCIVGTRSALFLPAARLGCIVLDEEHDASFKQDEGLSYQAKEVAWFRNHRSGGLLVLGSATPDVRSFQASLEGGLPRVPMTERAGAGTLPAVELVDLRGAGNQDGLLAPASLEELKATVARGEQAVIMLNRRGYAPLMYCLECGQTQRCPHCAIGLTYHKVRERLVCHYCGHSVPFPSLCTGGDGGKGCGSSHFLPMGHGTELVEEWLRAQLEGIEIEGREPGHPVSVLRLDRDAARRPGVMEATLESFAQGEAQVLVGTQMLSKGHHFPGVTLVVAADADLGLNLPDYRATERTFQLLLQVAGRAGRGDKPGRVLIQTRDPSHYCWDHIVQADYEGFFAREIERRRKWRYPPFAKLAMIRMSFPVGHAKGMALVNHLAQALRERARNLGVVVMGPAPSPLAVLRGRSRYQVLLKADDWPAIRALYAHATASAPMSADLRLALDLDPVNML